MSRITALLLIGLFGLFSMRTKAAEPVRLILDTDIGNDVDDALALAMIHALENRADVQLLAVTITKDNRYAAPFVDLVNTFYGRPDIPIGVVRDGKTKDDSAMLKIPAEERDAAGKPMYPHPLQDGSEAPDAVQLLTSILSNQPDQSVTIAQIGFSTNLARLLGSPGGTELVKRKVKVLCLMAGNFEKPEPEFNVYTDPESAKVLFAKWPTPMIFSGFEIGLQVPFPYEAIASDFNYVAHHPIPEAYRLYVKKPEDHPNWDTTAVLEAILPDRGYFNLSQPGRVALGPKNTSVFTPDPGGNCRYLIVKSDQLARVRQLIVDLVSEPPQGLPTAAMARRVVF
jgi:inosine-uridine nucleoside N-ribohydrolase